MKKLSCLMVTFLLILGLSMSHSVNAQTAAPSKTTTTTTHVKKDGTPDKRYKENKSKKTTEKKHLKKDGTLDKRFKENKSK